MDLGGASRAFPRQPVFKLFDLIFGNTYSVTPTIYCPISWEIAEYAGSVFLN